jgi:hypothetical protein
MPTITATATADSRRNALESIRARAASEGRTYLSWSLVYQFAAAMGHQRSGIADYTTLEVVVVDGSFDPWTRNDGWIADKANAAAQIERYHQDRADRFEGAQ